MGEVTAFPVSKSEIVAAWEKVKCREHGSGKRVKVNKFTYKSNFIRSLGNRSQQPHCTTGSPSAIEHLAISNRTTHSVSSGHGLSTRTTFLLGPAAFFPSPPPFLSRVSGEQM
jgi:hypothetical protein